MHLKTQMRSVEGVQRAEHSQDEIWQSLLSWVLPPGCPDWQPRQFHRQTSPSIPSCHFHPSKNSSWRYENVASTFAAPSVLLKKVHQCWNWMFEKIHQFENSHRRCSHRLNFRHRHNLQLRVHLLLHVPRVRSPYGTVFVLGVIGGLAGFFAGLELPFRHLPLRHHRLSGNRTLPFAMPQTASDPGLPI